MEYPVFAPHICLGWKFTNDLLAQKLRPMIQEITESIASGISVNEAAGQAAKKFSTLPEYFNLPAGGTGAFSLKNEYFQFNSELEALYFFNKETKEKFEFERGSAAYSVLQKLVTHCGLGRTGQKDLLAFLEENERAHFEMLLRMGIMRASSGEKRRQTDFSVPGLYRLQHASLLLKTPSTGILTDPHFRSIYEKNVMSTFEADEIIRNIDAVVISHSHYDHYDLTSLMMLPRDMRIIVPHVPASTILCDNMEKRLKSLGFTNVIAPRWYSDPVQVGDVQIHVLPFFGEQATLKDAPFFENAWNHGNTYVFKTEDFSCWVLIDSGTDFRGCMNEVAHRVMKSIGPIDAIMSTLKKFFIYNPLYINGGLNWLSLSPDQMARFPSMSSDYLTLGPGGVAEICEIVRAKYFLPYANLWANIGSSVDDINGLERSLKDLKSSTSIVPWRIGDRFLSA